MTFTDFCARSGGSNLNSGTKSGNSTEPGTTADYTSTNGNWDGTSIFTPVDGSTPANSVSVGDFASVFLDAATVAVYIARVTVVAAGVNGAITLSTTAKSGTAPSNGATGRTIKVGGAWKGPNAAEGFPINFITGALTNSAGDAPRVNLKNDATYSITAGITQSATGSSLVFKGYTTSYADGGKAIIDGGTTGASYALLTASGQRVNWEDIIFQNNGATGSANGVTTTVASILFFRCVFNNVRGNGIQTGTDLMVECEAYACNQSNTANFSGIRLDGNSSVTLRCISHDNSGSNSSGFLFNTNTPIAVDCIADTNGGVGFQFNTTAGAILIGCDAYNNTSDGIKLNNSSIANHHIENCNLVKNGGYGINGASGDHIGFILNCGFGSGTQANSSGATTALKSIVEIGSINYASGVTPWVDPANGDFRINLAAAIGAGRGNFTETQSGYAGTVGYPDIGAAMHIQTVKAGNFRGGFIN